MIMIEFVVVGLLLYYFWTRTIVVDSYYHILVERKWLIFFDKWKSYRLLAFGRYILIPFIDGVKKDKGGKPVQFPTESMENIVRFTISFKNATKLKFEVKALYFIKDLNKFTAKIQGIEDVYDHIYDCIKNKLIVSIQKMEPKNMHDGIFKIWVNKDKTFLEEYGISIKEFIVLDVEIVKNTKMLTYGKMEEIININERSK
jgi:hypothetical protein